MVCKIQQNAVTILTRDPAVHIAGFDMPAGHTRPFERTFETFDVQYHLMFS
jgi:hypothetical protein